MDNQLLLNLVLYLPLAGALVIALIPKDQDNIIKNIAIWTALANIGLSLALLGQFKAGDNAAYQFMTDVPWIPQINVRYKVAADGISVAMIVLTTVLSFIAMLSSWESVRERVKEYFLFLLVLETGMLGVFTALDLVLFYVFWEITLIPMYFLIGIWGGKNRQYATIKFVLYTLVGALLMLVAIVWIYVASAQQGQPTFDLEILTGPSSPIAASSALGPDAKFWLFLAFSAAFAVKVPMFPLHTWLPDAHVEAPTAGSVILAGVLLKMGTYGFLRFAIPLFPEQAIQTAPWFLALAVIGIIYGALMAYVQQDIKRLVAYSSVSHLGFCMLGLFAFTREGVMGSVLQMINHGLSTGALFLLVGMIYERRHTREISAFGGIWKVIPVFGVFMVIAMLSSVGLPGLNGFVGEFYILLGTWGRVTPEQPFGAPWASALGATGVILGAVYMLWMFQRVMQGPLDNPENKKLKDLNLREVATLLPLVVGMFWIGIFPGHLMGLMDQAVQARVVQPLVEANARIVAAKTGGAPAGLPGGAPGGLPPGLTLPGGGGLTLPGGAPAGGVPGGDPHGGTPSTPNRAPARGGNH